MATVVLVIHLLIALALIAVVLLQRSEGGALGIGGGPAGGSLFSSRGSANALTRATAMLAVAFFITSITLTIINRSATQGPSVIDQIAPSAPGTPGVPQVPGSGGSVLPQLPGAPAPAPAPAAPPAPTQPQVPQ